MNIFLEHCPFCDGEAAIHADFINHSYEDLDYKTRYRAYLVYGKCLKCGATGQKFQTKEVFLSWDSRYTSTSPRKELYISFSVG